MFAARRSLARSLQPRPPLSPLPSPLHRRTQATAASTTAIPSQLPAHLPPATHAPPSRLETLRRTALPFSEFLTDTFARQHTYLRLSITERCNLRCLYCMPAAGVPLSPSASMLSTPELLELSSLFVREGVTKIRLTGGEPTIRRDIFELVESLGGLRSQGLEEIAMTSNGVVLGTQGGRKLQRLVDAGLRTLNLSLDTLVPAKFEFMTRRKGIENVRRCMEYAAEMGFGREGSGRRLKINCVVMRGVNDDEMLDFVELTRERNIDVRFIEYMPFDGNKWSEGKMLPYASMVSAIRLRHPDFSPLSSQSPNDTSKTYRVPGYAGTVGFITSMTHNFCGACNRLRITGDGNIKVCLFGDDEVSLRDLLRQFRGRDDPVGAVAPEVLEKYGGEEGEGRARAREEMERILREVVGVAVKGKKKAHGGIPWRELKDGKNRPMILIDKPLFSSAPVRPHVIPVHLLSGLGSGLGARCFSTDTEEETQPVQVCNIRTSPSSPSSTTPSSSSSSSASASSVPTSASTTASPEIDPAMPVPAEKGSKTQLPHLTPTGTAHMVSISPKSLTERTATASATVRFSHREPVELIRSGAMAKGDVLAVARIAGIMAAKKCPDIVPLAHPILLEHVGVDITLPPLPAPLLPLGSSGEGAMEGAQGGAEKGENGGYGVERVDGDGDKEEGEGRELTLTATVACTGKTGVEMEALTAVTAAALTVVDLCKAVDKRILITDIRVVEKRGGRSGDWKEGVRVGPAP